MNCSYDAGQSLLTGTCSKETLAYQTKVLLRVEQHRNSTLNSAISWVTHLRKLAKSVGNISVNQICP